MPGGEPLWPGKFPNPGGRPYGEAIWIVSKGNVDVESGPARRLLTSVGVVRHLDFSPRRCK
jgi:hypothetical protein